MQMRTRFQRTSAAYPNLVNWGQAFDLQQEACQTEMLRLAEMQKSFDWESESELLAFCETVADDISEMTVEDEISLEQDTIDDFRLIFAALPMEMTLSLGLNGDCYSWIMWTVARGYDRTSRVFSGDWSFFPPDSKASDAFHRIAFLILPRWTTVTFMIARKLGGLDQIARAIAPLCWGLCEKSLSNAFHKEDSLEALTTLANWASNAGEPQSEAWVKFLLHLWREAIPDRSRAQIGILMMTAAHRFTGRDFQSWAEEMLVEWPHILTDHFEVQVLANSLRTKQDWTTHRSRILEATTKLVRSYRQLADDESSAIQALESRVSIIHPLIYFLTENAELTDLLDVLGAWYGRPMARTCDDNILFVASAHKNGVAYLWQGGKVIISRDETPSTLSHLLEAASAAQREYHRVTTDGDRIPDIDFYRMGQPNELIGAELESAFRDHFDLARLSELLPKDFSVRSVLTMPAMPVPILGMLASELGIEAAEEVSLEQALPIRPIRRMSVWHGATMHAEFEIEALSRVAELAGWNIDIFNSGGAPEAFEEFYVDMDADILWVIGHGEHSPHRLENSGLVIGDALYSSVRLKQLPVSHSGRRLLVLNVCSGAATQLKGGIARIGISQELVNPSQQIAAHLWPIGMYAGLAFGSKFALELAHGTAATAYARTIQAMRNPANLREDIINRLGDDLGIHERLAGQDAQIGNVLSWGAPVLLT